MKIVVWDDMDGHDISIVAAFGDGIIIEDSMYWWNLEEGDMIQHVSEGFGTSCYFVTKVEQTDTSRYPRGVRLVTIKGAIS